MNGRVARRRCDRIGGLLAEVLTASGTRCTPLSAKPTSPPRQTDPEMVTVWMDDGRAHPDRGYDQGAAAWLQNAPANGPPGVAVGKCTVTAYTARGGPADLV
jgi:hypothetical protein